ncbi:MULTISPECIES: ExbD/TolR family protein [Kordiimonas]|uniref:ExbD/TolR family protein n=1 Tax=Kordiimonas TaxID=288021 RepID=UPI001FF517AC|nr:MULTISPECIES: biopolymer transporter ExbD [Kordiimonas]MCK0069120.1 biopolymer transporter ExbD [Kordiimonas laminariae]UTW58457.1 biopolymer transporter ExbD [Kordiimonas sp. SCSIO 12603]
MRKFAKAEEEAEVNMTPMLDIVFIMLIFFIVTATFVNESGLEINKPEDNNSSNPPPPDEDKRAIAFVIDENNRITHDFLRIDVSSVSSIIKKESVERPEAPVVIQAAKGSEFGLAIRIYDAAKAVGLGDEKIVMTPKK